MRVGLVARPESALVLAPLVQAWERRGFAVKVHALDAPVPSLPVLQRVIEEVDAVLVAGDRRCGPRRALPGPVLNRSSGSPVPVAWIPDLGPAALGRFATAAAALHARAGGPMAAAVLSQWHPRYLQLAQRIEGLLDGAGLPVRRWTSDLLIREDMAQGLGSGLGLAVYVGHGRPIGWVGYRGTRIHHLDPIREPLGALLSLCCLTASRWRNGLSFAEAVAMRGVAASALGAVSRTLHTDNTRWAVRLCEELRDGAESIGALIVRALPVRPAAVADYRLLGDPTAPLAASAGWKAHADAVPVSS